MLKHFVVYSIPSVFEKNMNSKSKIKYDFNFWLCLKVSDVGKDDTNSERASTTMLVDVDEAKIIDFGD